MFQEQVWNSRKYGEICPPALMMWLLINVLFTHLVCVFCFVWTSSVTPGFQLLTVEWVIFSHSLKQSVCGPKPMSEALTLTNTSDKEKVLQRVPAAADWFSKTQKLKLEPREEERPHWLHISTTSENYNGIHQRIDWSFCACLSVTWNIISSVKQWKHVSVVIWPLIGHFFNVTKVKILCNKVDKDPCLSVNGKTLLWRRGHQSDSPDLRRCQRPFGPLPVDNLEEYLKDKSLYI